MADNVEQTEVLIQEDRSITVTDVDMTTAEDLHIPSSVRTLGTTKFVPKQLTDECKWAHMNMCMQFLQ
jgi:hypothetical protein